MAKEAQQYEKMRKKKATKERPLGQNDRNNGPQSHKIIKWPQRKQTGQGSPKE